MGICLKFQARCDEDATDRTPRPLLLTRLGYYLLCYL